MIVSGLKGDVSLREEPSMVGYRVADWWRICQGVEFKSLERMVLEGIIVYDVRYPLLSHQETDTVVDLLCFFVFGTPAVLCFPCPLLLSCPEWHWTHSGEGG